jgi:hypothetical protein
MMWYVIAEPCHVNVLCIVDVVLVLLYESLDFPDLMSASNIGCDLPWFATRRRSFRLLSPSLAYLGIPADLKRS